MKRILLFCLAVAAYPQAPAPSPFIGGAGGGSGSGTVTQIDTTSPITGGPITDTGAIACPTCVTSAAALTSNRIVLGAGSQASAVLGSLGTTTTILHGNAAGAPTFGAVVSADLSITTTSCTNQFVSAISAGAVGTCSTVPLAALATQADQTILTNISGGAAVPTASTLTAILDDILGTTQGSIIYRNATVWTTLGPGTSGEFLKTLGAGANPDWDSPPGAAYTFTNGVTESGGTVEADPSIVGFLGTPNTWSAAQTFSSITLPATVTVGSVTAAPTQTIASGAKALDTDAITSEACDTMTATATGAVSTDTVSFTPNADITAVTGYAPETTGGLAVYTWITANTLNIKVCNPTSGSITPGAVTLNWRITR